MMLRTGVNEYVTPRNDARGLTLIEVMVTVAILSLMTVTIAQSNLMNLNVYTRFANRVAIQNWAEQKVWEAKEHILTSEIPEVGSTSGVYQTDNRVYSWTLDVTDVSAPDLYSIALVVNWKEGGQDRYVSRYSFVNFVSGDA